MKLFREKVRPVRRRCRSKRIRLPTSRRANTIRILISDLLFPEDPPPLLRHCTHHQGSLITQAPFTQQEAKPDWQGNYEFVDAETSNSSPHRIEPSVLRSYVETYKKHFSL